MSERSRAERERQRTVTAAARAARAAHRKRTGTVTALYPTSPVNRPRRPRRTQAQLDEIDQAIYEVARAERPVTMRGVFYRVMSLGLVPKSEKGYDVVQREALKLRRSGDLPYSWITDGSRLVFKADTWSNAHQALENTARFYRQALWNDQDVHVEVWTEKDAIRGVVHPITDEYDVPLMISRGYPSETFLQIRARHARAAAAQQRNPRSP